MKHIYLKEPFTMHPFMNNINIFILGLQKSKQKIDSLEINIQE